MQVLVTFCCLVVFIEYNYGIYANFLAYTHFAVFCIMFIKKTLGLIIKLQIRSLFSLNCENKF